MNNLKILIVEGNLREENQGFLKVGIETHTESLMYSLKHYSNELDFDVINHLQITILKRLIKNFQVMTD